jgi:hypothetical protein
MPHKILPLDIELKSRIASIYEMAGEQDRWREFSQEIVSELEPQVAKGPSESLVSQNIYMMLLQAYEGSGNYNRALSFLQDIRKVYAKAPGIEEFITREKSKIDALVGRKDTASMSK